MLNFIGLGIALYIVARVYGWAANDSVIKHTVKCKYCRKRISEKVSNVVWIVRDTAEMLHRPDDA